MWCLILLTFALQVRAEMFNITECDRDGKFYIWKYQQPSFTCTGIKEMLNIYWSLTAPSASTGEEKKIGNCRGCNVTCPRCKDVDTALYDISRPDNESITLQFLDTSQIIAGSTLKCSRYNNKTEATCRLFTESVHQMSSTAWPVAAVATGAAGATGFLLLLAVVIAIAVILRRRRSNGVVGNRTKDSARGVRDVAEERISAIYHEVDDTDSAESNDTIDPPAPGQASDAQAAGTGSSRRDIYPQVNTAQKNGLLYTSVGVTLREETTDIKTETTIASTALNHDHGFESVWVRAQDKSTPENSSPSIWQRADPVHLSKAKVTRPQREHKVLNPTRGDEPREMTETAESDDEYRSLRFTRPCQVDTDSTYSHLIPL